MSVPPHPDDRQPVSPVSRTAPAAPADPSCAAAAPAVSTVIVLAAGAGTRMKSRLPKVLHEIAGRPLLWHALRAATALGADDVVAVIGHGREQVGAYLTEHHPQVRIAVQTQQRGTGHAVAAALHGRPVPTGTVVISYGDSPLLRPETLRTLVDTHTVQANTATVLTARLPDPTGYGRIVRDAAGNFTAIVEQTDADAAQLAINEINSGVYAFDGPALAAALPRIGSANAKGEQYLTDAVALAAGDGLRVGTVLAGDPDETAGVNDRVQLAQLARILNDRLVRALQLGGVTVLDPATTWVHADVRVDADTVLRPGTSLEAGVVVGSGCDLGPDTTLVGGSVGDGARVLRSHCDRAEIGPGAQVGPFSYLRPAARLAARAKVGAYVEVKGSTIGEGSKVPHLSYIGDATIGAGVNIGAGTITANYDGASKFPTVIGDHVFVGTNSTLVAPVTLADGSFVAAGSTVTDDAGPGDLVIARGRQHLVAEWVLRRWPGRASAAAARRSIAAAAASRPTGGSPVDPPT